MPTGPKGEKRPRSSIASMVQTMKIATGTLSPDLPRVAPLSGDPLNTRPKAGNKRDSHTWIFWRLTRHPGRKGEMNIIVRTAATVTAACIPVGMALMILTSPSNAGHEAKHLDDNLIAFCNPIKIDVSVAKKDAPAVTLSDGAMENAVESRLRAANLYSKFAEQVLSVRIVIVGSAFSVRVKLSRWAAHTGFGYAGWVTVWNLGNVGTHGDDGQYIAGVLPEILDRFITEYLRHNEEWCRRRREAKLTPHMSIVPRDFYRLPGKEKHESDFVQGLKEGLAVQGIMEEFQKRRSGNPIPN